MKIKEIYRKKQYECQKCKGKVEYGKVYDDVDQLVTKDRKEYNGKFGKESNALSAAVNIGTETLHQCYASNTLRDFDELTCVLKQTPVDITPNTPPHFEEFKSLTNDLYQRLNIIAAKFCGEGAMVKDKHITTMGLMHDYFSFISTKR